MRDLLPWATETEKRYIDAVEKHGSARSAARALGLNHDAVSSSLRALARRAARAGHSPAHDMTHTVPDGYSVKGVSTLYTPKGVAAQWVKSSIDHERQAAMMREAIGLLSEQVRGSRR